MKYCKYLDREKKGYVTVGDVGTFIVSILVSIVTIYAAYKLTKCGFILLFCIFTNTHTLPDPYSLDGVLGVFGAAFILAGALISLIILVVYVSEIKISECELK